MEMEDKIEILIAVSKRVKAFESDKANMSDILAVKEDLNMNYCPLESFRFFKQKIENEVKSND